jgi:RsiW-degrading membrane proteinase PrsW (M82 family)
MRNETLLKLSAVVFAVLWTLLMWWSRGPLEQIPLFILVLCGALGGALWYWLYGMWFRWYIGGR